MAGFNQIGQVIDEALLQLQHTHKIPEARE